MPFALIIVAGLVVLFGLVQLAPANTRVALWVVVIAAGVVPWSGWQGHEHWAGVNWLPFSGVVRPRDLLINWMLYLPLGVFLAGRAGRSRVLWATLAAVALSLLTELTQVYSHGRFPSMTDVVMNGLGGLCGAWLASRLRR